MALFASGSGRIAAHRGNNGNGAQYVSAEEHEITIEIICNNLPGSKWDERGPIYLGIQKGKEIKDARSADAERIRFNPVLRVRGHTDGSANFLGPFAHGPRGGRFIYLVWAVMSGETPVAMAGRIKILLDHIEWANVQRAAAKGQSIKVTIPLTSEKGRPVFASVRPDRAKWQL
jgi:hypothetical protein